jgi:hypothetical protein
MSLNFIHLRRLAVVLMLPALILTAHSASAASILTAKSLICAGSGPLGGSIAVAERNGTLTLRVKGTSLVPGQAVTCGYTCGMVFTTPTEGFCGTVGANGRFSGRIDLGARLCFGFIPFFNTPSTGKCVPSVVP